MFHYATCCCRWLAAGSILAASAVASSVNPLASLSSLGTQGSFASILAAQTPYWGTDYVLNVDDGQLYAGGFNGSTGAVQLSSGPLATFTPRAVAQPGGSTVNVFDFASFSLPQGYQLIAWGNAPAAILSQADTQIAGAIISRNANSPGATSHSVSIGPNGGGNGGNGWGYVTANTYGFAGSGGGGGLVSAGTAGDAGVPQYVRFNPNVLYWPSGGAGGAAADLGIFEGGGGGGLGGYACGYCGGVAAGGYGGGALFFGDTGNFTITSTGSITANGAAGQLNGADGVAGAAGGGGAGGYLWFSAGGTWENDGAVSAQGGAGAVDVGATFSNYTNSTWGPDFYGGNGSGGFVNIDPTQIIDDGTIDVAGGGGASTGLVDYSAQSITGTGEIVGSLAPEPGAMVLALGPAIWLWRRSRRLRG